MREIIFISIVFSMVAVLAIFYLKTGNFRYSFIVMLIVGKVWAGLMWIFGVDATIVKLVVVNRLYGTVHTIPINASTMVFLTLFLTMILTVSWPYVEKYLPKPFRRIYP